MPRIDADGDIADDPGTGYGDSGSTDTDVDEGQDADDPSDAPSSSPPSDGSDGSDSSDYGDVENEPTTDTGLPGPEDSYDSGDDNDTSSDSGGSPPGQDEKDLDSGSAGGNPSGDSDTGDYDGVENEPTTETGPPGPGDSYDNSDDDSGQDADDPSDAPNASPPSDDNSTTGDGTDTGQDTTNGDDTGDVGNQPTTETGPPGPGSSYESTDLSDQQYEDSYVPTGDGVGTDVAGIGAANRLDKALAEQGIEDAEYAAVDGDVVARYEGEDGTTQFTAIDVTGDGVTPSVEQATAAQSAANQVQSENPDYERGEDFTVSVEDGETDVSLTDSAQEQIQERQQDLRAGAAAATSGSGEMARDTDATDFEAFEDTISRVEQAVEEENQGMDAGEDFTVGINQAGEFTVNTTEEYDQQQRQQANEGIAAQARSEGINPESLEAQTGRDIDDDGSVTTPEQYLASQVNDAFDEDLERGRDFTVVEEDGSLQPEFTDKGLERLQSNQQPGPGAGPRERTEHVASGFLRSGDKALESLQEGDLAGVGDALAGSFDDAIINAARESATKTTPHANMVVGSDEDAAEARANKEAVLASRAEQGWEDITGGRLPSTSEAGALLFQAGEVTERGITNAARTIEQNSPTHGMGPEIGNEALGSVPGNVVGGILGGIGMGIGAGLQAGPSTVADATDPDVKTDGQTPSEITGAGDIASNVAESQVELATERPVSTAALFAAPAAEAGARAVKGYRTGRGKVIDAERITTEASAEGNVPEFRTSRDAPTSKAVREVRERAAEQPDIIQEGASADRVLYHTTPERLGREVRVREGGSELPGLWAAPDANPVGLRNTNFGTTSRSALESLRPRKPDLSTTPDRVAAIESSRIEGMPDWAQGSGYEVRGANGGVIQRGLSRGRAKELAEQTPGETTVAPDQTTGGYQFLDQQAEPGTAYVRPTGSRTTELEAVFGPETQLARTTEGPSVNVRFGGREVDVPFTSRSMTVGGEITPVDFYRRTSQGASETASTTSSGVKTAAEVQSEYTPVGETGAPTGTPVTNYGLVFGDVMGDTSSSTAGTRSGVSETSTRSSTSNRQSTTVEWENDVGGDYTDPLDEIESSSMTATSEGETSTGTTTTSSTTTEFATASGKSSSRSGSGSESELVETGGQTTRPTEGPPSPGPTEGTPQTPSSPMLVPTGSSSSGISTFDRPSQTGSGGQGWWMDDVTQPPARPPRRDNSEEDAAIGLQLGLDIEGGMSDRPTPSDPGWIQKFQVALAGGGAEARSSPENIDDLADDQLAPRPLPTEGQVNPNEDLAGGLDAVESLFFVGDGDEQDTDSDWGGWF